MVFLSKYLGRADEHITDEIPLSFSVAASSALRIGLAFLPFFEVIPEIFYEFAMAHGIEEAFKVKVNYIYVAFVDYPLRSS